MHGLQVKAENLALRQMIGPQGGAWDPPGGTGEKELLLAAALEEEQGRRGRLQEDNARLRAALVGSCTRDPPGWRQH